MSRSQATPRSAPSHAAAGQDAARTRVLCVDDAPEVAVMLERTVRHQPDIEWAGAIDTAEGLAYEAQQRHVDVVILDLSMPGPDPLAAIIELHARLPHCLVLAYSGSDDPRTKQRVMAAGADGFVSKDVEPDEVIQLIRRLVRTGTAGRAAGKTPKAGWGGGPTPRRPS